MAGIPQKNYCKRVLQSPKRKLCFRLCGACLIISAKFIRQFSAIADKAEAKRRLCPPDRQNTKCFDGAENCKFKQEE